MSEYTEVEQPFLQQLAGLGWTAIDQRRGIPLPRSVVSAVSSGRSRVRSEAERRTVLLEPKPNR